MSLKYVFILIVAALAPLGAIGQKNNTDRGNVTVDKNGVMRWEKTKEEVTGFGVNYTVPFAYAYRAADQLGISKEKAIDDDVYHFARLGFDLFRVHVWDCEISDTLGNLLDNDHLKLFDYMLKRMKDRGINFVITPIAYWGNGYPQQNEPTPGFSTKYGKANCLTDPGAIKAQERYLYQFLNHVNPYTGVAYKDEPAVIAFEVCNEPHHGGEAKAVTDFVNVMVKSMRSTGCKKPIFYNVSHSIQFEEAYFKAAIQGGTFQWYPTGLVSLHELKGNMLPNVDNYEIPFDNIIKSHHGAKLVYEFDAADIGRSYIYPAMARSFRKAGIQLATHFAYDPSYTAYANTEYNTHYMNLVYAPQKALSLMIAGEVFRRIPMYKDFGKYPVDTLFDAFHVSYNQDLAEMVTDEKFIYTNNTLTRPLHPDRLDQIAGYGNSPVIAYDGRGAYFLDRLESGVWRLEVMPDAFWVRDPFGRNSLSRDVAVISRRNLPMTIHLPDLGSNFAFKGLNDGNEASASSQSETINITPGVYLLVKKGVTTSITRESRWKNLVLKEYAAPAGTLKDIYVLHTPGPDAAPGMAIPVEAVVVSKNPPESVVVNLTGQGFRPHAIALEQSKPYVYKGVIPAEEVTDGFLDYTISVKADNCEVTFPAASGGGPDQWDFADDDPYEVRVVRNRSSLYLFDAKKDAPEMIRPWSRGSRLIPLSEPGRAELVVTADRFGTPENIAERSDFSFRVFCGSAMAGVEDTLSSYKALILRGRSIGKDPATFQVALVTRSGQAFGATVSLNPDSQDYRLPLSDFHEVQIVTLPRPYPTFLPYYFDGSATGGLDLKLAEAIQFSIVPGADSKLADGVALESVRLDK